jgi:hypothetical protein
VIDQPPDEPVSARPLRVEPEVMISTIPDDVLRKMPHAAWLAEFSQILGMTRPNGPPMTPFRQGAIAKLKLASRYIELLEKELHWAQKKGPVDGDHTAAEGR